MVVAHPDNQATTPAELDKLDGETLYQILRVNQNATQEQIKKAFRKLALIWHPDKCSGAEDKFKKMR